MYLSDVTCVCEPKENIPPPPLNVVTLNLLKPTGYVMHRQIKRSRISHSAHTVFMCFIFISEQMVTFAPYNIN